MHGADNIPQSCEHHFLDGQYDYLACMIIHFSEYYDCYTGMSISSIIDSDCSIISKDEFF